MKTLLLVLCLFSVALAGVDVLLLVAGPPNEWDDIEAELGSDSRIAGVTYFAAHNGTPALSYLLEFDVVIVDWSFLTSYMFDNPMLAGNRLAQAVDQGISVILGTGVLTDSWDNLSGAIVEPPYCPLVRVSMGASDAYSRDTWDDSHPIFDGVTVPPTDCECVTTSVDATAGSTVLAQYAEHYGVTAIQVAANAAETVVAINYALYDTRATWDGDGWLMLANACAWLANYSVIEATTWGQIKALN